MEQALPLATDPAIRQTLGLPGQNRESVAAPSPEVSLEVSLRRATGLVKNARLKHGQASAALLKARGVLDKAQKRVEEAALTLASAEQSRRMAVNAVAERDGLVTSAASTKRARVFITTTVSKA